MIYEWKRNTLCNPIKEKEHEDKNIFVAAMSALFHNKHVSRNASCIRISSLASIPWSYSMVAFHSLPKWLECSWNDIWLDKYFAIERSWNGSHTSSICSITARLITANTNPIFSTLGSIVLDLQDIKFYTDS